MAHQLYVIEFQNGKKYFGITKQKLAYRWKAHLSVSKRHHTPICRALRKYEGATIKLLVVGNREYIHDLEIRAIKAFRTTEREFGYNFGQGGEINPMLGQSHTQASLAKISKASKKRPHLPESNAKTSAALKNHDVPLNTRIKISAAVKAIWKDPKYRARVIPDNASRDIEIYQRYILGKSKMQIAAEFGISRCRVHQIIKERLRQMTKIPASEIITVPLPPALLQPLPGVRYAVMVNRTPRYISAWRRRKGNETVLVLPFFSGPVEEAPDFSRVRSDHIALPFYVGNFENPVAAIKEIARHWMAAFDAIEILDESPRAVARPA